jgi:AAA domain
MAKASTLSPGETQRVLVYGPPKVGKTELVLRLAEHFNLIYFGLERGHAGVFKLPMEWRERIEIIDIPDTRSFPVAAETALKVIKGGSHSICELHGKVFCMDCMKQGLPSTKVQLDATLPKDTIVVWDSLTQLSNSFIAHITKAMPDLYKLQTDDWGQLAVLVDLFLSAVQGARYHTICISHETEAETVDGKARIVPVCGSRNSSRNIAKYFDHVIYCNVENGKHNFGSGTLYRNGIITGSRTDALLESMATPSLLDIMRGVVSKPIAPTPGQVALGSLSSLAATLNAKDNPLNALNKAKEGT